MKNIKEYLVKESRTADLFLTVGECIKNPKSISDGDINLIIKTVKQQFNFELSAEEAKALAQDVAENFPEMIKQ